MTSMDQASTAQAGRPWWKVCCAGCLLIVVAFIGAVFIIVHLMVGPGAQLVAALPSNYPADLAPYKIDQATSIQYLPGKTKGKILSFISIPLSWISGSNSTTASISTGMKTYGSLLEGTDRVTITWNGLTSTRSEIVQYYVDLFKKNGMTDQAATDDATGSVSDVARNDAASVQLYVQDLPDVPGVDRVVVTVDYIPKQ